MSAFVVGALAALAMSPDARALIAQTAQSGVRAAQAFALPGSAQAEIELEEMRVYAVQLGAYDNGEHAQKELNRLLEAGIPAVIWQKEQMRLICSAALSRVELEPSAAQGQEAWVIEQTLAAVTLRAQSSAAQLEDVRTLLTLPDALFAALSRGEEKLTELLLRTRTLAEQALDAHPEQPLYTQLAQSLVNWCALMEQMQDAVSENAAHHYASATMALLCDELRQALLTMEAQSEASTASAQRTPSTAAEVMPPA